MGVTRRSISNHTSGEPPSNPFEFALYLREQLGLSFPPGGRRKAFLGQLKDEMELNGWSYQDLIATVAYVKAQNIRVKEPYGIFFHVNAAISGAAKQEEYDLVSGVAQALSEETDETWIRRLSLAKGRALEKVFEQWRNERGNQV
jgi:hypothetical protein